MKLESCDYYCVKQFERLFETEYNSFWDTKAEEPEFVAFYAEPVQGVGGYIVPPPEYFLRLKKILDERKILLVDDEVQMGFFRTGRFWGIEHFGVKPNIVVFGHEHRVVTETYDGVLFVNPGSPTFLHYKQGLGTYGIIDMDSGTPSVQILDLNLKR